MAANGIHPAVKAFALLALVGLAVFLAIPNLIEHRCDCSHNQTAAIGKLKAIGSAQSLFREGDKEGDQLLDYASLSELTQAALIESAVVTGPYNGYTFASGPGTGAPEFTWWATATPAGHVAQEPDAKRFFLNHEGVIYFTSAPVVAPITSLAAVPPGWVCLGQ